MTNTQDRTYQDTSGSYQLPNDTPEHDRLDGQAQALQHLMGKTVQAPLNNPRKIVDIGCGTGIVTAELGRTYPNAQVIGVDISPVPARHDKPPNVTYIQGDIKELAKGSKDLFAASSFDYIFHRLLFMGMTGWPEYIKTVCALLAPGGWLELQELDLTIYNADGSSKTGDLWYWSYFLEDSQSLGLDPMIGSKLASMLKSTSELGDIEENTYRWPTADPDPAHPEGKVLWEHMSGSGRQMAQLLIANICGRKRDAEMVKKLQEDVGRWYSHDGLAEGSHARLFVVLGQKPAK